MRLNYNSTGLHVQGIHSNSSSEDDTTDTTTPQGQDPAAGTVVHDSADAQDVAEHDGRPWKLLSYIGDHSLSLDHDTLNKTHESQGARQARAVILTDAMALAWSSADLQFVQVPKSTIPGGLLGPRSSKFRGRKTTFKLCDPCLPVIGKFLAWRSRYPDPLTGDHPLTNLDTLWTALHVQNNLALSLPGNILNDALTYCRWNLGVGQDRRCCGLRNCLPRFLVALLRALPVRHAVREGDVSAPPRVQDESQARSTNGVKTGKASLAPRADALVAAAPAATASTTSAAQVSQSSQLIYLPPELLQMVFEHLDARALIDLHLTCHAMAARIPLDARFWRTTFLAGKVFGFFFADDDCDELGEVARLVALPAPPIPTDEPWRALAYDNRIIGQMEASRTVVPDGGIDSYDWRTLVQILGQVDNTGLQRPLNKATMHFRRRRFAWYLLELVERRVCVPRYVVKREKNLNK